MPETLHDQHEVGVDGVASYCDFKASQGFQIVSVTSSAWEFRDGGWVSSRYLVITSRSYA